MFAASQISDFRAPFKSDPSGPSTVSTNNDAYSGPGRRAALARSQPRPAATTDGFDYGMLLRPLTDETNAIQVNRAPRLEPGGTHALQLPGAELRARRVKGAPPLAQALRAAARRGLRKLLNPGQDARHQIVTDANWVRTPRTGLPVDDPLELLSAAELADWTLLHMVICAAAATLVLATATALVA